MAKKKIDKKAVLDFLTDNPGSTAADVAGDLNVSIRGIAEKMARMRDAGLVTKDVVGRVCYYSASRSQPFGVNTGAQMFTSLLAKARNN